MSDITEKNTGIHLGDFAEASDEPIQPTDLPAVPVDDDWICVCPDRKCKACLHAIQGHILRMLEDASYSKGNLVRPKKPWGAGKSRSKMPSQDVRVGGDECDEVMSLEGETTTPELNKYLLQMEKSEDECLPYDVNNMILSDVSTMVNRAVESFKRKYPETFGGAVIHRVGSVAEGTKIGLYDEFDFMVELPAVEQSLKENKKGFEAEVDYCPESVDLGIPFPPAHRQEFLQKELLSVLLPGWKIPTDLTEQIKGACVATLVNLRYFPAEGGDAIDVFCDIAFCFPFELTPQLEARFPLLRSNADTKEAKERHYFLLNRSSCKSTDVFRENRKLINSNAKRVYRLLKILTKDLFPPVYDSERNKFEGPIPSYWLKQIILYMVDELPNPESWNEASLGTRVTQVFETLERCLATNLLFKYFSCKTNLLFGGLDGNFVARKYCPKVAVILRRAANGNKSDIALMSTLCRLKEDFVITVTKTAHLTRLAYILYTDENLSHMNTLQDIIQTDLNGIIELHCAGSVVEIHERVEGSDEIVKMTIPDYVNKYMASKALLPGTNAKMFPSSWEVIYDRMLEEQIHVCTDCCQ